MAIPVVGETVQSFIGGNGSDGVNCLPPAIVAGDLLFICCSSKFSFNPNSGSIMLVDQGFIKIGESGTDFDSPHYSAFYKIAVAGDIGATVRVSAPGGPAGAHVAWYSRLTGYDPVTPIGPSAFEPTIDFGNPHPIPGVITLQDNALALYGYNVLNGGGFPHTPSVPWAELFALNDAPGSTRGLSASWGFQDMPIAGDTGINDMLQGGAPNESAGWVLAINGLSAERRAMIT